MATVRRVGLALTFGLFLLGSCCFLTVALVQGAFALRELRFETQGLAATGTVTATHTCTISTFTTSDIAHAEGNNGQITGQTLTVRYVDQQGAAHTADTHMCMQQSYVVGAQVPIRYLRDDPGAIATQSEVDGGRGLLLFELALLAGMLAFAGVMLWAFLYGLRRVRAIHSELLATAPPYQDAPIPRIVPPAQREPGNLR
jgi:hypothetical protein